MITSGSKLLKQMEKVSNIAESYFDNRWCVWHNDAGSFFVGFGDYQPRVEEFYGTLEEAVDEAVKSTKRSSAMTITRFETQKSVRLSTVQYKAVTGFLREFENCDNEIGKTFAINFLNDFVSLHGNNFTTNDKQNMIDDSKRERPIIK